MLQKHNNCYINSFQTTFSNKNISQIEYKLQYLISNTNYLSNYTNGPNNKNLIYILLLRGHIKCINNAFQSSFNANTEVILFEVVI